MIKYKSNIRDYEEVLNNWDEVLHDAKEDRRIWQGTNNINIYDIDITKIINIKDKEMYTISMDHVYVGIIEII